jgi:hypothetical protein
MGAYELMEGKLVGGRCVWRRGGAGLEAFLYRANSTWWIGNEAKMESGEEFGWIQVTSDAMTPDAITEQWQAYNGASKTWHDAPKITTRLCTDYERQKMLRQAKEAAEAKARDARIVELLGQEAGEVQHDLMGAYELMEEKLVGGRCVWRRGGAGLEAFLYLVNDGWWIGNDEANMESGRARGRIQVTSDAMTPDAITEQWQAYNGATKTWQYAPKITTRVCTDYERQKMLRQAKEAAEAKARDAPIVELLGQGAGDVQHCMMGAYELMEGKLVGGRCVWKRGGTGSEAFLYRANSTWWIDNDKASMESGRACGRIQVTSDAMTPDAITEQWEVWDGATKTLQYAPKITTRVCTDYERQEMLRQAKDAAEAKARDAPIVELSGQEAGEVQHCMMGAYELMEEKLVGGRCVWRKRGAGSEAFLYRANSKWWIGSKANMESGRARGWIRVTSNAMTPDAITEQWEVWDGASKNWQDVPNITTRLESDLQEPPKE